MRCPQKKDVFSNTNMNRLHVTLHTSFEKYLVSAQNFIMMSMPWHGHNLNCSNKEPKRDEIGMKAAANWMETSWKFYEIQQDSSLSRLRPCECRVEFNFLLGLTNPGLCSCEIRPLPKLGRNPSILFCTARNSPHRPTLCEGKLAFPGCIRALVPLEGGSSGGGAVVEFNLCPANVLVDVRGLLSIGA